MNISSVGTTPTNANAPVSLEDKRAALQATILKKTLEAQSRQAQEILREIEGKGQILDIRV